MADLVLLCECGLRVKAPGAIPGRVGRCPNCGGRLRVPDEASAHIGAAPAPVPGDERPRPPRRARRKKRAAPQSNATGGLLPPLESPERGPLGSFLYPLRGADAMGVMAFLSVAIWTIGTAVPEYCGSLMQTASSTGYGLLGNLIVLITAIPFLIAAPFVAYYWLAYLGRVLVSGAKGETAPPRTPDRNFDGFWIALSPWAIWLFWGFGVGFAPAMAVAAFARPRSAAALWTASSLGLLGFGYSIAGLMLAHIHGQAADVTPSHVLSVMLRLVFPLAVRCVLILTMSVGVSGAFVATLLLRDDFFGVFLIIRFGCGLAAAWASIVAMRLLGVLAYHRRAVLRD